MGSMAKLEDQALAVGTSVAKGEAQVVTLKATALLEDLDALLHGAPWMTNGTIQAPLRDALSGVHNLSNAKLVAGIKAGLHDTHSRLAIYTNQAAVRHEGLHLDHVLANRALDDIIAKDPATLTVGDYRRLEAVIDHADTLNFPGSTTQPLSQ